jgi:hypothetical protein
LHFEFLTPQEQVLFGRRKKVTKRVLMCGNEALAEAAIIAGCDLSKFAIQVTRKRLLDIHNSKDLLQEEK